MTIYGENAQSFGGLRLTNIADGVHPNDAVNKSQLDGIVPPASSGAYKQLGFRTINLDKPLAYEMQLNNIVGAFIAGETISDINGNTATIYDVDITSIVVYAVNFMSPPFSGVITSSGGATGDFVSLSAPLNESQIPISLSVGVTGFIATDIILINASVQPDILMTGFQLKVTSAVDRGGVEIASLGAMSNLANLDTPAKFFNHLSLSGMIQMSLYSAMSVSSGEVVSSAYVSVINPNSVPCTLDVYLYGYEI